MTTSLAGSQPPEVVEEVKALSASRVEGLRRMAQTDLYFLCNGVLGMADLTPYTHGPLCRFMEREPANRRLVTVARGTLKSSICTVGHGVQLGLRDHNGLRLGIFSESGGNATGWLHEIKQHFRNNEIIAELFPEVLPERYEGPGSWWKDAEACLRRDKEFSAVKEATYTAFGIESASTSQHYNYIKLDDLIGEAAKGSPGVMERANRFLKALTPLLVDPSSDVIDLIGTRKGLHDSYGFALTYFKGIAQYHRPAIENGKSVFPERLPLEFLQELLETDPITYYSEYDNNPIGEGSKDFDATRIKDFDFDAQGNVVYRDANGVLRRWNIDQLDVVMTVDPNSGSLTAPDYPAIVVSAVSPRDQVFVLDSWARRVDPEAFVDRIYEMWRRWKPRVLGIEQVAQQNTLFYFKKKAKDTNQYINVGPVKPGKVDKAVRIRKALAPIINQGRLYIRRRQEGSLKQQITFFPDVTNDDEIDALAYGALVWRSPLATADTEEDEDAKERVLAARAASRNGRTGYSA